MSASLKNFLFLRVPFSFLNLGQNYNYVEFRKTHSQHKFDVLVSCLQEIKHLKATEDYTGEK